MSLDVDEKGGGTLDETLGENSLLHVSEESKDADAGMVEEVGAAEGNGDEGGDEGGDGDGDGDEGDDENADEGDMCFASGDPIQWEMMLDFLPHAPGVIAGPYCCRPLYLENMNVRERY